MGGGGWGGGEELSQTKEAVEEMAREMGAVWRKELEDRVQSAQQ